MIYALYGESKVIEYIRGELKLGQVQQNFVPRLNEALTKEQMIA
jgi:hypothetical protein